MSIIPTRTEDLLNWMDTHGPVWAANATGIGLSGPQGTGCATAATTARAAFTAKLQADEAARVANLAFRSTLRDSRETFAEALAIVKAYAENQGKPELIYNLAQIPPPAAPGPAPAPGIPTNLRASLEEDGSVTLRWKAAVTGSGGVVWTVMRRLGAAGPFAFTGVSGLRKFTDGTIPAGETVVQYQIRGQRGQTAGPACSPFTVQFGGSGGGLTIAAQFSGEGDEAKMAA